MTYYFTVTVIGLAMLWPFSCSYTTPWVFEQKYIFVFVQIDATLLMKTDHFIVSLIFNSFLVDLINS